MMAWKICLGIFTVLILGTSSDHPGTSLSNVWKTEEWGNLPSDASNFLSIMFHKFATDEKGLTISNFEQLLNCTLGVSECPEVNSVPETPISYLTNCTLNSALSHQQCDILNKCITGREILSLLPSFNQSTDRITEADLRSLLPSILYQAQSQFCKRDKDQAELPVKHKKPTNLEVWGYGILFVTIISACSLAGVSVLPLMDRQFYQKLLTVLIGLAVGSLAASAVFHLIPQAYGLTGRSNHHEYLNISLMILFGVWAFFMIERILKIIFTAQKCRAETLPSSLSTQTIVTRATKENGEADSCTSGSQNYECVSEFTGNNVVSDDSKPVMSHNSVNVECGGSDADRNSTPVHPSKNLQLIYASQEHAIKASFGHDQKPEPMHEQHEIHFQQGKDSPIATVAWMIIFGDGFHNFIDGVSIGAAFQQSILTGISISLAVVCEELPHELGDFAILLNSGMTMKQALFYNFMSATTCYIGMVCGILLGEFTQNSTFIFALAAGMFLYISFVDMIPEMNETATRATKKGVGDVIYVLFLQNIGLFLGVFSLFFLAYYQDNITLG